MPVVGIPLGCELCAIGCRCRHRPRVGSTPITTTGLPFTVRLDSEGVICVRLASWDTLQEDEMVELRR
jgi:hypothetical protein